ncbi:diguanylate cyclase domain-containing protein [Marinobacter nauticus]|uniref:diguanylate cyclase domain-containing protein n=1 Tax=Marinobacter nauticus TaxID=2743 RepID=UPI001615BCD2|nr:diguanylate cyclase [Marinobacter nauticus]MBY6220981.1 diguanylate cyclase [Marinobacter nauticus]
MDKHSNLRYRDFFPLSAGPKRRDGQRNDGFSLSDMLPLGILVTDRNGICLYSNAAYQELSGWSGGELIGSHWSAVIHPKDREKVIKHWNDAVLGQASFRCESRIRRSDGKTVWVRRNAILLADAVSGHGYVHTAEDIAGFKSKQRACQKAEQQLFEERDRARVTLDAIGDAVISTDINGLVTYMNLAAESLTRCSRAEVLGQPLNEIIQLCEVTTGHRVDDPAHRAIHSDGPVALEANMLVVINNGVEVEVEDTAAPVHDRKGMVVGAVIVFREARFSREAMNRMVHLAQHDALTGLQNRNAFYERFDQALAMARRHDKQMGLLFIDLDNFKGINDILGHQAGDMILSALAGKLRSCVRAADTVCRYGGDEFVVLLSEIARPDHVDAVAEKIRRAAAVPMHIGGQEVSLQLSIGMSVYPDNGESAEDLVRSADVDMYRIKNLNRSPFTGSLIIATDSLRQLT